MIAVYCYLLVGVVIAGLMLAATGGQPVGNRLFLAGSLVLLWPSALLLLGLCAVSPPARDWVLRYIEGWGL